MYTLGILSFVVDCTVFLSEKDTTVLKRWDIDLSRAWHETCRTFNAALLKFWMLVKQEFTDTGILIYCCSWLGRMESKSWAWISEGRIVLVSNSGSLVGDRFKRKTAKEQKQKCGAGGVKHKLHLSLRLCPVLETNRELVGRGLLAVTGKGALVGWPNGW